MGSHNIIIVGANFGGIGVAHYLLRHTIPLLESQNHKSTTYKVTLISPSTHFFFKIAAPRIVVDSTLNTESKGFQPIANGFKEYPSDRFALLVGSAVGLDEAQKIVTVEPPKPSAVTSVAYDTLVIATGTTSTSALWTLHGSHEKTVNAFKDLHQSLPSANSILIAGGGPAGTETAGNAHRPCSCLE